MELLGERPVWSMGGGELLSTLDALDAEIARMESYRLSVVAGIESTGYAAELGARDTAELLRFRYRLDAPTARRTLRLAQALSKYPAVSAALDRTGASPAALDRTDEEADDPDDDGANADGAEADGAEADAWLLRPAQADAIVTALERVPAHVPIDERDAAERQLVKLAAHLSPGELRQAGNRMRDILDTDGPEPEELKAYDRESLTLMPADRGVKFRGYLANENAELLRALIHAGARPHKTVDGEPDLRSRDKRQADALTAALGNAAAAVEAGQSAPKAQVTVTIDFEDLKAATADASGQLVYGDGLSSATVRRLACDAQIIPLVLGSNSEPLDVGRSERLVTRAMRRALNARDNGCVICGAPPIMCDAHHMLSWIDGGETKISNLALLCRRHHVDLHHGTWTISITNDTVHVTRPTWADPPPAGAHRSRWKADAAALRDASAFASAGP
ncbi:HNH endonuclease [Kribbella rubisoli]|uniref:HNH endonuclease n=1 Tax=Kribbella rubisoli TaxID=3075929 RepID=A0A4Q7WS50_9ACTN|nr:HNH endonuclease signature motif containing protein [Kribbella rubisoli]RZU12149.1 HNH endonuclease [Kribbella rubisoli]